MGDPAHGADDDVSKPQMVGIRRTSGWPPPPRRTETDRRQSRRADAPLRRAGGTATGTTRG